MFKFCMGGLPEEFNGEPKTLHLSSIRTFISVEKTVKSRCLYIYDCKNHSEKKLKDCPFVVRPLVNAAEEMA